MNRALRRISIAVLVMFLLLLINVNYLQGFEPASLASKPGNSRAFYAAQNQYQRGSIVTELNTHPAYPLSTLRCAPRDTPRKTRGRADRYSFPVRLFHSVGIEPARASFGLRFAGPPDNPGQPDFPGPVRNIGIFFPGPSQLGEV